MADLQNRRRIQVESLLSSEHRLLSRGYEVCWSSPVQIAGRFVCEIGSELEEPRIPRDFDHSVNSRVAGSADLAPERL